MTSVVLTVQMKQHTHEFQRLPIDWTVRRASVAVQSIDASVHHFLPTLPLIEVGYTHGDAEGHNSEGGSG